MIDGSSHERAFLKLLVPLHGHSLTFGMSILDNNIEVRIISIDQCMLLTTYVTT